MDMYMEQRLMDAWLLTTNIDDVSWYLLKTKNYLFSARKWK